MMKVVIFFLSMIIIWVDKYHFRCNLAIGNGIKKFITISVVYYNFGCQFSAEIVITEIVIKKLLQFRSVITISVATTPLTLSQDWYFCCMHHFDIMFVSMLSTDEMGYRFLHRRDNDLKTYRCNQL